MDRQELINHLIEIRETLGESAIHAIADDIRASGDHIHDPVFSICVRCGNEFEVSSNGAGRKRDSETCLHCQYNDNYMPRKGRLKR